MKYVLEEVSLALCQTSTVKLFYQNTILCLSISVQVVSLCLRVEYCVLLFGTSPANIPMIKFNNQNIKKVWSLFSDVALVSEKMQQIYRRRPTSKYDFNKVAKQLGITRLHGCAPVNLLHILENLFLRTPMERLLLV